MTAKTLISKIKSRDVIFVIASLLPLLVILFILYLKSANNNKYSQKQNVLPNNSVTKVPMPTNRPIGAVSVFYVDPAGNDANDGSSQKSAFKTIQKAVDKALPGDSITLASGVYRQDVITKRNGMQDLPIIIRGSKNAVLKGNKNTRIFEINHNYITLDGFSIDGLYGDLNRRSGFRDKLLYVQGKEAKNGVTGLKVQNMTFKNAGGECIRLRYFAHNNEISNSTISNCGVYYFVFKEDGKNGEGIYIGTAPEQLRDGRNPTKDSDNSMDNWIHHNKINTQGNECVDIKEGSTANIVEFNDCTGQKDIESGGLDSRGNNNVFRNNTVYGNKGAGIRLGGDTREEGIKNDVYDNVIKDNESGGIKIQRIPQGKICGNKMSGNTRGDIVGSEDEGFSPTALCR